MSEQQNIGPKIAWFQSIIGRVETGIYVAVGILLVIAAVMLVGAAAWHFVDDFGLEHFSDHLLVLIDKLLLTLMIIELLYTVRVSLRARGLIPEPFLIIGLIAAMRRVLLITAETWHLQDVEQDLFQRAMLELGLLTVLTLILVISLVLLRRYREDA
jgi:uncharacterized membrane protein